MKVKTDDTAWSGFDPSKGPPPLKAVDQEVKSTATSDIPTKMQEATKVREARLEDLAKHFHALSERKADIDQELSKVEGEIAYYFPEEAGDIAKDTRDFSIIVTRNERWAWDKAALEEHFGQTELPDYVNRSLSVDKRKFSRLPSSEQNALKFALTRHLNSPKVKVVKNV